MKLINRIKKLTLFKKVKNIAIVADNIILYFHPQSFDPLVMYATTGEHASPVWTSLLVIQHVFCHTHILSTKI